MHDPDVYLINFLPPDMRMEVEKDLIVGFTNYIETVAYLLQQNQLPKPRMITSCVKCVPNTNKECVDRYVTHFIHTSSNIEFWL